MSPNITLFAILSLSSRDWRVELTLTLFPPDLICGLSLADTPRGSRRSSSI